MYEAIPNEKQDRLDIIFYHNVSEFAGLHQAWADLTLCADQPLFFQSPNWLRHVLAIRNDQGAENWRLCLATAWRQSRLVAVWPLLVQREGICRIARSLDDPFGQLAGLPIDQGEDASAFIVAVTDHLKMEGLADGVMIERVADHTDLHRALENRGAKITFSDQSAVVDFRPHDNFQAYLKTRKPKTRKNLRNARNRLTRDHGIEHDIITGDGDIRSIVDQAFKGRLVWMQDNAKTAPAFRDSDFRRLLSALNDSPVKDSLIGFRLRSGDMPIAVQWGFLHAGRYYAFISARNPKFDAYSPGRVHLGMVLEACFERGISVVELMAPASAYKMNWTDESRRIDDFGLAFNARGYLYLDLWRRNGRSMARRLYHGLPDSIKRHVADLTGGRRAS
ncbi:MAG: GNAT family N-acetyltransferase [Pseudomonadota bacterium]